MRTIQEILIQTSKDEWYLAEVEVKSGWKLWSRDTFKLKHLYNKDKTQEITITKQLEGDSMDFLNNESICKLKGEECKGNFIAKIFPQIT